MAIRYRYIRNCNQTLRVLLTLIEADILLLSDCFDPQGAGFLESRSLFFFLPSCLMFICNPMGYDNPGRYE